MFPDIERCPKCGSKELYYDDARGEIICRNCGEVIREHTIQEGPEWRSFTPEQRLKRERASPVGPQGLLSTSIGGPVDAAGHRLDVRKTLRLRKMHVRAVQERGLHQAMGEIRRIASQLNLPKTVVDEAIKIYKAAAQRKLIKGRSIEAMSAAALFAACRVLKIPVPLTRIASFAGGNQDDVSKCYSLLLREGIVKPPVPPILKYIPAVASKLNLSLNVQNTASRILQKAIEAKLTSGRRAPGMVAAALYIASIIHGERRTQEDIAKAAGVTVVTLRNHHKELLEYLEIIVLV